MTTLNPLRPSEQGFKDIDFYTIEDGIFIELLENEKNAPPGNQ